MAEIIKAPELRYTQDGQTPLTEMLVQFAGLRAEDPMATLKVVGWGNLAQQIQEQFHQGDRVIIEGRLTMNTIDRPEGFKEKRAEFTASRIHAISGELSTTSSAVPAPAATTTPPRISAPPAPPKPVAEPAPTDFAPNYDDIPF